jgi:Haem-binding domain
MKIFKKIFVVLLVILVVIQFIRPTKNTAIAETSNHIYTLYPTSTEVKNVLTKACFDCHSNNTNYPWYANIQPVAWWLNDHIVDGKKHLNFSEYGTYKLRRQYHKMEEVIEEVKANEMPLNSYTWIHSNAKLTIEEKSVLTNWAQSIIDTMKAKYPIDSLEKKKS